jgi:peptidoglycan/LPS O-acetylase OafA/YrhL
VSTASAIANAHTAQPERAPSPAKTHLNSVDLMRGLAASWVLFYHLWNRYFPNLSTQGHPFHWPAEWGITYLLTAPLIQFGYMGVTLFFVISGFCIHLPQARRSSAADFGQARTPAAPLAVRPFFLRRFWRLYPAYLASIVLACVALGLYPTLLYLKTGKAIDWVAAFGLVDAGYTALFLQHLHPQAFDFNGVYWTLVFEVQFYLLYPLLLLALRRFGIWPLALVFLLAEVWFSAHPLPLPHVFITRLHEWYLGVIVAELYVRAPRHSPGWAGLLAGAGLLTGVGCTLSPLTFPYRDVFASIGFFGLFWLVISREASGRWMQKPNALQRTLVQCGVISYSLYLIHGVLIDIIWNGIYLLHKYHVLGDAPTRWLPLLCIPAAYALAVPTYRHIEARFMHTGQRR